MAIIWSHEKIIAFLNDVQEHPELWDREDSGYKDKKVKRDSWNAVAAKYNISFDEAYKKFKNLRTYAQTEAKKKGTSSTWFAFDAISFILSRDFPEDDNESTGNDSREIENRKIEFAVKKSERHVPTDFIIESDDVWNSEDTFDSVAAAPVSKCRKKSTNRPQSKDLTKKNSQGNFNNISKEKSPCSAFGEHVAYKLNSYDSYTRAQVEFRISKILFEADMGLLPDPLQQTSPQDSKYGLH